MGLHSESGLRFGIGKWLLYDWKFRRQLPRGGNVLRSDERWRVGHRGYCGHNLGAKQRARPSRKFWHGGEGSPAAAEWDSRVVATEGRMRDRSAFNPEVRRWSWRKLRAWSDDLPRRDQLSRAVGGAVNDRAGGWQLWFSGRRASHGLRFSPDESTRREQHSQE